MWTHCSGDEGFSLQEVGEDLLLNTGQITLRYCLMTTLQAVLAVG